MICIACFKRPRLWLKNWCAECAPERMKRQWMGPMAHDIERLYPEAVFRGDAGMRFICLDHLPDGHPVVLMFRQLGYLSPFGDIIRRRFGTDEPHPDMLAAWRKIHN
jgi:hypothetical protein